MFRPDPKVVSTSGPGSRVQSIPSKLGAAVLMETDRLMPSYPGRSWVIASLTCAGLALAVTPVVFGPLGVRSGFVAAWKGARWWGTAGVSASFVAAVVSAYLSAWLST